MAYLRNFCQTVIYENQSSSFSCFRIFYDVWHGYFRSLNNRILISNEVVILDSIKTQLGNVLLSRIKEQILLLCLVMLVICAGKYFINGTINDMSTNKISEPFPQSDNNGITDFEVLFIHTFRASPFCSILFY